MYTPTVNFSEYMRYSFKSINAKEAIRFFGAFVSSR